MPRRGDDTDELDDREWPEPDPDDEPEAAVDTVPCPFCKARIYDDAERCPHCGNYPFYDGQLNQKPWWLIGGVAICLLVVLYWIFRG